MLNHNISISPKLRAAFGIMETAAFIEWREATPERKLEITKKLGEFEGQMIINEIEEETNKLYPLGEVL